MAPTVEKKGLSLQVSTMSFKWDIENTRREDRDGGYGKKCIILSLIGTNTVKNIGWNRRCWRSHPTLRELTNGGQWQRVIRAAIIRAGHRFWSGWFGWGIYSALSRVLGLFWIFWVSLVLNMYLYYFFRRRDKYKWKMW